MAHANKYEYEGRGEMGARGSAVSRAVHRSSSAFRLDTSVVGAQRGLADCPPELAQRAQSPARGQVHLEPTDEIDDSRKKIKTSV